MINLDATKMFSTIALASMLCMGSGGCNRDVRLAGRKVQHIVVQTVSHYGLTLDEQATPLQVAFVALRAIREDITAKSDSERDEALQKQFDVAAANVIQSRNKTMLSRDEFLYNVVYRWTPTVSHYAQDFETEWETAKLRFVQRDLSTGQLSDASTHECKVMMEVDDPNGDPNARVVLILWMTKDTGFWRVVHLGFDTQRRSIEQTVNRNGG